MKKNTLFTMLFVLACIFFLTGCQSGFPVVKSSYISKYIPVTSIPSALTFDGNALTLNDFSQIDLKTGQISHPFASYLPEEWQSKYSFMNLKWSPDGRYLSVGAFQIEPPEFSSNQYIYILDTIAQSVNALPDDVKPYYFDWSPLGKRLLIYPIPPAEGSFQIYDLNANGPITKKIENTFTLEKQNAQGAGSFLWLKNINIPAAEITWGDPINSGGISDKQEIYIRKLSIDQDGTLEYDLTKSMLKTFIFSPPNNAVYALFDPSGEYILVLQWKCSNEGSKQCSLYHESPYFDNIVDTSLILIRWRTGEQKELIRLSQIDTKNVIALNAEWSADGSTIFVARKDAPAVVLKVK